jgi:hypothetical protein
MSLEVCDAGRSFCCHMPSAKPSFVVSRALQFSLRNCKMLAMSVVKIALPNADLVSAVQRLRCLYHTLWSGQLASFSGTL